MRDIRGATPCNIFVACGCDHHSTGVSTLIRTGFGSRLLALDQLDDCAGLPVKITTPLQELIDMIRQRHPPTPATQNQRGKVPQRA